MVALATQYRKAAVWWRLRHNTVIIAILAGGSLAAASMRNRWRMPPVASLAPRRLSARERIWLVVLRAYLLVAAGLVLVRIVTLLTGAGSG